MKFNVLLNEVKAAMIFASNDEARYVLNGVLFEVKKGKAPILVSTDGRRLSVIQSNAPQDEANDCPDCSAVLGVEFLKPICTLLKGPGKLLPLTIDLHLPKRAIFQCGSVAVDVEDGAVIQGDYPKWRQIVPTGEKEPINELSLNAEFIGDFAKASVLLGKDLPGIRMNIFSQERAIEVHIDGADNFYSVIMPTRQIEAVDAWQPEFLGIEATPCSHTT